MNRLKLTIRVRLALAFGAMLLLTLMLGAVSLWRAGAMKDAYEFVSTNTLASVQSMNNMSAAAEAMRRSELRYLSLARATKLKEQDVYKAALEDFKRNRATAKGETGRIDAALARYLQSYRTMLEMDANAGTDPDKQDAVVDYLYSGDSFKTSNELRDAIKASVQRSYGEAEAHRRDGSAAYRTAFLSIVLFTVLELVVGVGLLLLIARSLVRQLGCEPDQAAEIAGRIAEGDLATPIALREGDRTSLLAALKAMRDNLAAIVGEVRQATDAINVASREIADGNMDLSGRTEAQAGALEETASAMEQLTGNVRQNADNAQQANALTRTASGVAERGGGAVSQVVATMGEINESSRKIVDIIGVIDGIAFQTNILALNAAVEAARAGEQGRGFAVVASEVRSLAHRSATAAKEIKTLIGDSVERVAAGSEQAGRAGATMQEVVASIRGVSDIMAQITAASFEQTQGIEQVNQAIVSMDSTTQQNAALVEQAASAAAALREQAASLVASVARFKLAASESAAGRQLADAAPPHAAPLQRNRCLQ